MASNPAPQLAQCYAVVCLRNASLEENDWAIREEELVMALIPERMTFGLNI